MQARQRLADRRAMAGVGRRIHMPSRKVTIAAGRPASLPSMSPAVLHRLRTGEAARRQMLHQREEERQVAFGATRFS